MGGCLYVAQEFRTNPIERSSWEQASRESGRRLADLWLANKYAEMDLWGFDGFGEGFVEAFLKRILKKSECPKTDFDEVMKIRWYYGCQMNLGEQDYIPINERHEAWIKRFIKENFG